MQGRDGMTYQAVLEDQPWASGAIKICSVPLRFTRALVRRLLNEFAPDVDAKQFWEVLDSYGLLIQRDESEWRLDGTARQCFLNQLEQGDPTLAQQVHATVLEYWESTAQPTADGSQKRLQRAYHTTPSDQDAGADLYWSVYCRARASNRFALLPVVAHLAESQAYWLSDRAQDARLYRAAALYYEGSVESKQRAAGLLESILERGAPTPITLDASFLLATLREQTSAQEAVGLYQRVIELGDQLELADGEPVVKDHLRLTLAKSYFSLAGILQTGDDTGSLDKAEAYYRYGFQIVRLLPDARARYEAPPLKQRLGLLAKRGDSDEIRASTRRISQIEDPVRQAFLAGALSQSDIGYLYYAISALNHGLGYERQVIEVDVAQDGSAQLEGTYALRALATLGQLDTYLETAPESDAGVHFGLLESLTPDFKLSFGSTGYRGIERAFIKVDPPLAPGDKLRYRWTAKASPGTFATTAEQLRGLGFDAEHVVWEIIVPVRHLEVRVTVPVENTRLPRVWYELWRIGTWHPRGRQAATAYRAQIEDDPSRVQVRVKQTSSDMLELGLVVNYPWMAMSYSLSWEVL